MTLTPEMVEIAPCPFCGEAGKHIHRPSSITKWQHQVECSSTTCGASGPFEASRADAMRAWNARAQSQRAVGVEAKLDAPAKVGAVVFSKGVSWSSVIACAQRAYAHKDDPSPSAEDVEKLRALIERVRGGE